MQITMLTTGTRGDTQPYIALGVELQRLGYQVRVTGDSAFSDLVIGHGLKFVPLAGDVAQVATSDLANDARNADNPLKFVRSLRNEKLSALLTELTRSLYDACLGSDAIVYHPGAAIGYFAAREMGIPSFLAAPFPMAPTREYPSLLFYNGLRLGGAYNKLTHRLFEAGFWWVVRGQVKQFWKARFGRLPTAFGNPFPRQRTAAQPTLIGCSEHVFSSAPDWPDHVYNTGFWFLDASVNWQPPPALSAFLEAGDPPVYVGFGSIGDPQQKEATTRLVIDALRQAGRRGVLATGWHGMTHIEDVGSEIHILEGAPHDWLFPRMAAVVHHGGAGTTAAGLRAGVPAVIVPHGNDQFAWGRRVYELGVGAKPISRKQLTAGKLADAIRDVLQPSVEHAATRLGGQIAGENGSQKAAAIIHRTLVATHPKIAIPS